MGKLPLKRISPTVLSIAILGISLGFTQLSFAEECANPKEGHKMTGKHRSTMKQELIKELNLTPDQEKQMAEHRKQAQERKKETFTKMRESRSKLREELNKPTSDPKEIERLKNEIKNAHNQTVDEEVNGILELKTILTPEQFKKFSEKIQEGRKKFMEQREKHSEENKENIPQEPLQK